MLRWKSFVSFPIYQKIKRKTKETHHPPNRERIPQASQMIKERPTLPEFLNTPFGEIKMPLPTMLPIRSEKALSRVIFFLKNTASSSFLAFPMVSPILGKGMGFLKMKLWLKLPYGSFPIPLSTVLTCGRRQKTRFCGVFFGDNY